MPSSRRFSQPRDWICISCGSCIAGQFFTTEPPGKPLMAAQFSSVQSLSRVQLFAIPWITACQASLSITSSRSLLKPMSIKSVMPSSYLIFCRPLLLLPLIPHSIRVFSNESTLCMRWPKYWSFASASVLPMNTQDWSPLGWTGWFSLQSKGLSRVFSQHHSSKASILQHSAFSTVQLAHPYMTLEKP